MREREVRVRVSPGALVLFEQREKHVRRLHVDEEGDEGLVALRQRQHEHRAASARQRRRP